MAYVVSEAQMPRKTNVNRRICLNEDSMFFKLLNSIIYVFQFLLFNNTAPTFPVEAPAAAPATLVTLDAVLLTFRL